MGLLEKLFPGRAREKALSGYFKTLTDYQPVFTSFEGGVYEAQITRAAINAFATQCSKLKPEVKGTRDGGRLERLLQHRPNPWQTTSQFIARVATIFEVENNAFIVPVYDNWYEKIIGYYPICPSRTELIDVDGEVFLRYTFNSGQKAAIELSKVGFLCKDQYRKDFFGESNRVLLPTLQLIDLQAQGIAEGVKSAAAIRFMAKLATNSRPEDIQRERQRFIKDNFDVENQGGVLMFDMKYADVKQIESKPYIVDADMMRIINESVYNYFGTNEKILRNEWDESGYNAYYEGKVEPFAVQLGLALTSMTFSEREIAYGNEIFFSANRLQYASTDSKLKVSQQLLDRGILNRNEVREIWQLPPIEGGDVFVIRGEYMNAFDRIQLIGDGEDKTVVATPSEGSDTVVVPDPENENEEDNQDDN